MFDAKGQFRPARPRDQAQITQSCVIQNDICKRSANAHSGGYTGDHLHISAVDARGVTREVRLAQTGYDSPR
jgi:hypothetical protein